MSGQRSEEAAHGVEIETIYYDDWVKDNIPNLSGKVAIVTGANSGTGFWCANALAGKQCQVVLACRSSSKAEAAKADILKNHPDSKVDIILMDNLDLASVRKFAKEFEEKYDRLDFLVNNAGIMAQPYSLSKDGWEMQWQTNHLAHFLLTKLLWDKIVKTEGQSRVVQHSSAAHYMASPKFDKDHMEYPRYSPGFLGVNVLLLKVVFPRMGLTPVDNWQRYGVSKLCNVLFMGELAHKIDKLNLHDKVISTACHPGWASTNLQNQSSWTGWEEANQKNAQSAADGSLPLLMATFGTSTNNGEYFGPTGPNEMKGLPGKQKVRGNGNNKSQAHDLWAYSEECIGEMFSV